MGISGCFVTSGYRETAEDSYYLFPALHNIYTVGVNINCYFVIVKVNLDK